MYQAKISLTEPLVEFLADYKTYGFKDRSAMVRTALVHFKRELERQDLRESADLYAELYESDPELRELTEAAWSKTV
jgi:metal-responsive CopG/Arc/MetJ family transcriptional regulator